MARGFQQCHHERRPVAHQLRRDQCHADRGCDRRKSMKRFSIILFSAFCILHSDFSQTVLTAEGLAAFGKKPSSGGGGGGGGTWTLVTSSSTQGTTGNTTTGALNTSGANLITV